MSFMAFRSAGAPYKAPQRRVGDQEGSLQARLDFTPASSDLAHAVRGRESKAQRILARLRIASATSIELAKITHRFSARIYELRKAGHRITREDCVHDGQEWSVYMLEGGA